jgi:hypothetical protein
MMMMLLLLLLLLLACSCRLPFAAADGYDEYAVSLHKRKREKQNAFLELGLRRSRGVLEPLL